MFLLLPILFLAFVAVRSIEAVCSVTNPAYVGDGFCDEDEYNNAGCGWDGGDCCAQTCSPSARYACGVAGYTCLDPGVTPAPSRRPSLRPTRAPTSAAPTSRPPTRAPVTAPPTIECLAPVPDYLGDGYCDEDVAYNSEGCGWDGGDCCPETCVSATYPCGNNGYYCLNPGANSAAPTPLPPTRSPTLEGCAVSEAAQIGDGFCDLGAYNTEACLWDGGDCCEHTCVSTPSAACGINGYSCHLDSAAPSAAPTAPATTLCRAPLLYRVGDGFCDAGAEYNNALCDWDGGDCCVQSCESTPNPCGTAGYHCLQPEYTPAPTPSPSTATPSTTAPSSAAPTLSPSSPKPTLTPSAVPTMPCVTNCWSYSFESAVFNSEGTQVVLSFSGPMDQGGYTKQFGCSAVAAFAGAGAATCSWLSSSSLAIRLGTGGLEVGSIVTVLGGVLRRANTADIEYASALYMPETSVAVQAPANPIAPVVALRALANVINECDRIRIDASYSTGRGAGEWGGVSWAVAGEGVANPAAILSELASYGKDLSTPISFSNAGFSRGTVTITLYVTNFLGSQDSKSISVLVTDQIVPAVSIIGAPEKFFSQNKPIEQQAESFIPACLAGQISTLAYSWSILDINRSSVPAVSASHSPSRFNLPAFAVEVASYFLVVTATPNDGIAATYEVLLHVVSDGAVAAVRGGLTRTASALSPFQLDASASHHPSYPGPATVLSYAWSCAMASAGGADCGLGPLPSAAVLTFAAGELPVSAQTYVFTVAVSSNRDAITAAASVSVAVVASALPSASIDQTQTRYNSQAAISVRGVLGPLLSSESYAFSWSVSPAVGGAANSSALALALSGSSEVPSFLDFPVSFFANTLSPGVTYTLTLRAAFAGSPSAVAVSSMDIRMNTPPYLGALTVTPSSGTSLVTLFMVASRGWIIQADSYPVVYTLSAFSGGGSLFANSGGGLLPILISRGSSPFLESHLPPGIEAGAYEVTCSATAVDAYGSVSGTATATTAVRPAGDPVVVANLIQDLLDSAEATQNFDFSSHLIGVGAHSLNYADCASAPDCAALKRESCSTTDGTCGECVHGYLGVDGHANGPCGADGGGRRLADADAACTLADPSCHKKCPNDCSAAGTCVAIYNFANDAVDFCPANDLNCRVSCACDAGSYGASCALGEAEYLAALRTRDSLCFHFYQSLQFQDVSSEIVSSRLALASLILLDSAQISEYALTNCTAVVTETVEQFPEMVATEGVAPLVVQALSLALDSKGVMSAGLLNATYAAMDSLLAAAQSLSAAPIDVITLNIRVSSRVQSARGIRGGGVLLTVPTTLFEVSTNTQVAQVALADSGLTDADPDTFGLSIVQYTNNPSGAVSNSSIVSVQTTYNVTDANNEDKSLNFIIVLQNSVPFSYANKTEENVTLLCTESDVPYAVSANCSGALYHFTCPGNETAELVYSCPYFTERPVCSSYGGGGGGGARATCTVQSYTATSTTCACSLPLDVVTIGTKASASNIGSGFLVVTSSFLYTWSTVTTLSASDIMNNLVIFSFMVGLICALVIGLIYFGYRDIDNVAAKHRAQQEVALTVTEFFDKVIPKQFEDGAWPVRFLKVLSERHSFLCFFFPLAEDDYRTCQWLSFIGKLVNFTFVGTLLTVFFFGDDGTCERQGSKSLCLALKGPDFKTSICGWEEEYEFCEYIAPPESFLTLIILALAINILCVPLDIVVNYGAGQYKALLTYYSQMRIRQMGEEAKAARLADPEANSGEAVSPVEHELKKYPSLRATLIRAARLTKMQQQMDHLEVNAEVAILMGNHAPANAYNDENSAINLLADYVAPSKKGFTSRVKRKAAVGRHLMRQGVTGKNAFDGRAAIVKKPNKSRSMTSMSHLNSMVSMSSLVSQEQSHEQTHEQAISQLDSADSSTDIPRMGMGLGMPASSLSLGESSSSVGTGTGMGAGLLGGEGAGTASKLDKRSYQQLLRRNTKLARMRAERIKCRMNILGSDERKEIYLVRKFLVDNMIGIRRLVANRFFFGSFNDEFAYARKNITYLKVVAAVFPLYLAVICLYIFLYGVTLGSRSTSLWMISIGISYLQDIALLETCSIYMVNVVLVSIVYKDLKLLSNRLRKRAKAILSRVHGQMSLKKCYLQHLNAACRAARYHAELGMSRLLMSLNDLDMPKAFVPRYHKPQSKWYFLIVGLVVIKNFIVLVYLSFPDSFQDAIIETFVCCALNFFFIAIYLGAVVSGDNAAIAGIFVFFLAMLILLLPWTKSVRSYLWHLVFPRRWNDTKHIFDEEADEDSIADEDENFENEKFNEMMMEGDESSYDEVGIVYTVYPLFC
jgi:hypothetical protein